MLYHLHALIRLQVKEPAALDLDGLNAWVSKLIADQKMEIVIGPNVAMVDDEGNKGPTGSANIKTSHFAYHIWEESGIIQADLYTCGALDVVKLLKAFEVFKPISGSLVAVNREGSLDTIFTINGVDYESLLNDTNEFQQAFARTFGLLVEPCDHGGC